MREFKYLNESGSKKGNWYLNRFDYFEFYAFEGFFKAKLLCLIIFFLSLFTLTITSWYLVAFLLWPMYVSGVLLYLLHKKVCKYNGYFVFPKKIITKLKDYEKPVDVLDFDSLATMEPEQSGIINPVVKQLYDYRN